MKNLSFYNSGGNVIIRLLVGLVFLSEGIQKFLFPGADGVGHFIKLSIAQPQLLAPLVGCTEIVCGTLVIIGLFTRIASIPLMIVILNAIYFTKIPTLIEKGFWAAAHDGRADFCMFMGLLFLLIYGAGKYSVDGIFSVKK
jgi:putative oxidoreductase